MNNTLSAIVNKYELLKKTEKDLVLAIIIETEGSTYRKAGACMLITRSGDFFGLLGGGCFEGDLIEHAQDVFDSGHDKIVLYDMRGPEDVIWGLGLGCNGAVRILLRYLSEDNSYSPMNLIADSLSEGQPAILAIVCESNYKDLTPGSTYIYDETGRQEKNFANTLSEEISVKSEEIYRSKKSRTIIHENEDGKVCVFYFYIQPPPSLLLIGGGPDALPILSIASELGWKVSLVDYREAYSDPKKFPGADNVLTAEPEKIKSVPFFKSASAIVLMTHKFERDQEYLVQLCDSNARYIGLLGPAARREKLLETDGVDIKKLENRVFGPVGLDIGSELPEEIALSMIAEIQAVLNNKLMHSLSVTNNSGEQNKQPDVLLTEDDLHILIMAAGGSTRFGGVKQLLEFDGKSLLLRSVSLAKEVMPERIHIILGPKALKMQRELSDTGIDMVVNANWEAGISSSIKAGLESLPVECKAVLILLCDQPLVNKDNLNELITTWKQYPEMIIASTYADTIGVPAVFPRAYFTNLGALYGDRGAKVILQEQNDLGNVIKVSIPEAEFDINTQEDYVKILKKTAS